MKTIKSTVMILAMLLGFTTAFGVAKRSKNLSYHIYASSIGTGAWSYSDTQPFNLICSAAGGTSCEFDSDEDASYFNMYDTYSFPENNDGWDPNAPLVSYWYNDTIYQ